MSLSNEKMVWMYTTMAKIRQFETRVQDFFSDGKIPGFVHLYIGEEAVATGACANLRDADYITSTHRGHGHLIAKGGDLNSMMGEIFGRTTGYCKGKGGSMHIADVDLGILGANGIVGGGGPLANGAALAIKTRGEDNVAVCFFGDGASNQGTTQEAMNLASAWKLPVVFVNENNGYGISCPVSKSMAITDIADRAAAYDMPGVVVDGNDVLAVYEAVGEAVKRARSGMGPAGEGSVRVTRVACRRGLHRAASRGCPSASREPPCRIMRGAGKARTVAARRARHKTAVAYSPRRRLRPRPCTRRSNSALGSARISLATTPICHGITR